VSPTAPIPPGHPPLPGSRDFPTGSTSNSSPPGALEKEVVEGEIHLTGVMFEMPEGWLREPTPGGMMAPVAVIRLPKAEGDSEDGQIRITHFPGMKGLNDQNIQRWQMQVKSSDDADAGKTSNMEHNDIKFTTFDATGAYDPGAAMGSSGAKTGQRFIGVIIDHPQGPHFIKASGPVNTMTHWRESIDEFLKSGKIG
jgi:hypothetical protein